MDIQDCFQTLISEKKISSIKPWKTTTPDEIVLNSICFPIEIYGRIFIICTNHPTLGTQNNYIVNDAVIDTNIGARPYNKKMQL